MCQWSAPPNIVRYYQKENECVEGQQPAMLHRLYIMAGSVSQRAYDVLAWPLLSCSADCFYRGYLVLVLLLPPKLSIVSPTKSSNRQVVKSSAQPNRQTIK